MSVVDAVQRDLDRIRRLDPDLAGSGLAMLALSLAARVDDDENSATSISMCANALKDALRELRELTPVEEEDDGIDQLAARVTKLRLAAPAS